MDVVALVLQVKPKKVETFFAQLEAKKPQKNPSKIFAAQSLEAHGSKMRVSVPPQVLSHPSHKWVR